MEPKTLPFKNKTISASMQIILEATELGFGLIFTNILPWLAGPTWSKTLKKKKKKKKKVK
jgi:hypothetical protein